MFINEETEAREAKQLVLKASMQTPRFWSQNSVTITLSGRVPCVGSQKLQSCMRRAGTPPGTCMSNCTWSLNCFLMGWLPLPAGCQFIEWAFGFRPRVELLEIIHGRLAVSFLLWTVPRKCSASPRSKCWTNELKAHQIIILPQAWNYLPSLRDRLDWLCWPGSDGW